MKIVIANDKNLETHSLMIKIIRIFSVPFLNSLPSFIMGKLLSSTSRDGKTAVKQGGSTHALEAMYGRYERGIFSRGFFQGLADLFWHHCLSQPKAVRNRLKIVKRCLENDLEELATKEGKKQITILTIAGGSARAVLQSLKNLKEKNLDCVIKVINIEKSLKAIDLSKEIAKNFGMYDIFKWINDDAKNIKDLIPSNSVDIVEMVGLLDYFSYEKSVEIISQIHDCLKDQGRFVVGNICPNREQPFIRKIGWPQMYYRKSEDLIKILDASGFDTQEGKIILEPLKCHIVATIKK